eukprot:g39957.t1
MLVDKHRCEVTDIDTLIRTCKPLHGMRCVHLTPIRLSSHANKSPSFPKVAAWEAQVQKLSKLSVVKHGQVKAVSDGKVQVAMRRCSAASRTAARLAFHQKFRRLPRHAVGPKPTPPSRSGNGCLVIHRIFASK